jgi:hypothetical protein
MTLLRLARRRLSESRRLVTKISARSSGLDTITTPTVQNLFIDIGINMCRTAEPTIFGTVFLGKVVEQRSGPTHKKNKNNTQK